MVYPRMSILVYKFLQKVKSLCSALNPKLLQFDVGISCFAYTSCFDRRAHVSTVQGSCVFCVGDELGPRRVSRSASGEFTGLLWHVVAKSCHQLHLTVITSVPNAKAWIMQKSGPMFKVALFSFILCSWCPKIFSICNLRKINRGMQNRDPRSAHILSPVVMKDSGL